MFKRFLSCLLALVLVLSTMSFAAAEGQTTIRVAWWGSQTRHDITMQAIDLFMQKNPSIKVEVEFADWGGYWSKLATQAAGGQLPDVIQMDYGYLSQYAEKDILTDLKPYLESGALDVTNISESSLSAGMVGDALYALPTGTNAVVMMYRKDVLDEAGVTMPIAPTESEYIEIMKKVYDATGRTNNPGTTFGDDLRFLLRNYGLNIYNDEGTALGFDDPSYVVHIWQRYLDAVEYGYCLPVGETTAATEFDSYVSDVWACNRSCNSLAAYEEGSNCELELAVFPAMDDATQPATFFKPTMYWSVTKDSQVKDEAITFINYFTNDTDCFDIIGIDRGMPISSAIREHLMPKLDKTSQKVAAILDYLGESGLTSPIMQPDIAIGGEVSALFDSYFEQVQYGMVDDLTAHAQAFMDEANEIIKNSLEK